MSRTPKRTGPAAKAVVVVSVCLQRGHRSGSRYGRSFTRTAGPAWATVPSLEAAAEGTPASPARRGGLQRDPLVLPPPAKFAARIGTRPGIAHPARLDGKHRARALPDAGSRRR